MFLIENSGNNLYIFSRNKDKQKIISSISNFYPYFYVEVEENITNINGIRKIEDGFISIFGKPLKKIICKDMDSLRILRKQFNKTYEADVKLITRYVIDNIDEIETYDLRIFYFDIEVAADTTFPDVELPNFPIISIAILDSFTNKPINLLLRSDGVKQNIPNTIIFNSEKDLIKSFINIVKDIDPDIMTGWNSNKFDFPYLIRRAKQYQLPIEELSPMKEVIIDTEKEIVSIKGRIILDMMKDYMHFRKITNQGKASSYSLDYTAKEVLGKEKIKHDKTIKDMWITEPEKLIEYNCRDTLLVKEINEKLKLYEFFNAIRAKAFSQLNEIYMTSVLIDNLCLKKVKGKYILPSKIRSQEESKFTGAFVLLPKPGIYKNILCFDVSAMYPSIIKSFNISIETFNPKGEIRVNDEIGYNKQTGFIPQIIMDLEKERNLNKKLMKEAKTKEERQIYDFRQYAIKVLGNGIFGYVGMPGSRLYKKEIAYSITYIGQKIINWVIDIIKAKGYEPIYADTDSIFFKSKYNSLAYTILEGKKIITEVNSSFKQFTDLHNTDNCYIKMEFEKIIKKILFMQRKNSTEGAKKRYVFQMSWQPDVVCDGKLKYKGVQVRRSDVPDFARKLQIEVIDMIMKEASKEDILNYLTECDKQIRDKNRAVEELGIPKEIKNNITDYGGTKIVNGKTHKIGTPPVVTGAKYSNQYLGTNFVKGSKPKWIYIKNVPKNFPKTNIVAFDTELPKGFEIDYDLLSEKLIRNSIDTLFQAAGHGELPNINSNIKNLTQFQTKQEDK